MASIGAVRGLETEHECTLKCQNGSSCVAKSDRSESSAGGVNQQDRGLYCDCPEGFAGLHCEYKAEVCGNDELICLHGSKCEEYDGGYRCSQRDFEYCNPKSPHIEYYLGMAVAAFCVNGGKAMMFF